MEKRFCNRVIVKDGTCILRKRGFLMENTGTIENISLGGIFISSDIQVKLRKRLNITILLSNDSGGIKIVSGVVATRIENRGIAFKYNRLDHNEFFILQSFLRPKDDRYY